MDVKALCPVHCIIGVEITVNHADGNMAYANIGRLAQNEYECYWSIGAPLQIGHPLFPPASVVEVIQTVPSICLSVFFVCVCVSMSKVKGQYTIFKTEKWVINSKLEPPSFCLICNSNLHSLCFRFVLKNTEPHPVLFWLELITLSTLTIELGVRFCVSPDKKVKGSVY